MTKVNFSNTEIAFSAKSDSELKKAAWLFQIMNNAALVNVGSKLALLSLKIHLPIDSIVKATIFEQFCGGTTLLASQKVIDKLAKFDTQVALDYGAEAKQEEEDFNKSMREIIRAAQFAAQNDTVPIVTVKISGLMKFNLLEKLQTSEKLSTKEDEAYKNGLKRLDSICHVAEESGVTVFIDAEESWIQDTINFMVTMMMERYNKKRVVVYNTFQLYRHDQLEYLKNSHILAEKRGYLLGAKLVRGAYLEKERARADEMGYPSPIQANKESTDKDYNAALSYCLQHYETIASCAATHNADSCQRQLDLIEQLNIPINHPHVSFSQLYGMSDNLTFNIAKAGYNVSKYLPYGPVRDVVPYLIRRAQENTAVQGDMGRELKMIKKELKRRGK